MKPLLFLIPGTLCDRQLWCEVEAPLQRISRPVFLDVPGTGDLASVIEQLAADIERLRDGQSYALLGFSMGGYLAAALACRSALGLSRLLLAGNVPRALPASELTQRRQVTELIARMGYRGISAARAKQLLHPVCSRQSEIVALIQEMDSRFTQARVLQQLHELAHRTDLCEQLTELDLPVWLCHGDSDTLVDRAQVAALVARSEYMEQRVATASGHMLPLEQPEIFIDYVESWLEC
ncbi:MAG: alpha/beta fold hydrolase [Pseudomonadales bacterium]